MTLRALLDANVLYPATLRSLLLDLSLLGLYQAHWTDEIQEEWIRNLQINRPELDPAKLQRTRELMDQAIDTARISGYEHLREQISLPDPGDRHVVAAAAHGQVDLIVTQNLRDFPAETLQPLGLQAVHPDVFLQGFLAAQLDQVVEAVRLQRARFRSPPISAEAILDALERQGVPSTVAALRRHTAQL
jgi:hypothetical protein